MKNTVPTLMDCSLLDLSNLLLVLILILLVREDARGVAGVASATP